ncbi:hypothetical protein BHE97_13825 [Aeromicrobium sp. PE09-221]|uniref:restriction endonuclease subunit S n=1 Tax=Aeromicrobium sp. PE09-221 TaxID=1898043 RepID=UPI000B3E44F1|nr:restriction endonuclease subunit S [Aeromicrobium sp. PE09-221]OUZ08301.1 hypothetical protein BHE97_13825 [Aeromicrobium sp. PE09-221]
MSLNLDKSHWTRVTFGDVVRNVNETVRDLEAAGIDRVIAMEHMDPGELKISRWGSTEDRTTFTRRVKPGQTLFGKRRAYQRKVAYAEFDAVCSGDIYTFESDETQLRGDLLPFLVRSNGFFEHALGTSAGSLSPRTNWRELKDFEFGLPPLDEQKRIADLLWSVERHRVNTLSSEMEVSGAKSLMLAERLASGAEERGWPLEPVSELVTSGPTNGKSARANDEQRGVPTLSISAVRDGGVRGGDSVKWIEVDPDSVSSFRLQPSDFLVVRGNGNRSLTGRGGLVNGGLPVGCIYPDLLIRLRFNPDRMLPAFATEQWNSAAVHASLLENAKSTNGIWKINGKDIKSHQLVVPPLRDQVQILEETASFDEALDAARAEVSTLEVLSSAFLSEIFGGD